MIMICKFKQLCVWEYECVCNYRVACACACVRVFVYVRMCTRVCESMCKREAFLPVS